MYFMWETILSIADQLFLKQSYQNDTFKCIAEYTTWEIRLIAQHIHVSSKWTRTGPTISHSQNLLSFLNKMVVKILNHSQGVLYSAQTQVNRSIVILGVQEKRSSSQCSEPILVPTLLPILTTRVSRFSLFGILLVWWFKNFQLMKRIALVCWLYCRSIISKKTSSY
jgi:hypothetical protein